MQVKGVIVGDVIVGEVSARCCCRLVHVLLVRAADTFRCLGDQI